jgi:hypothetical protein
VQLGDETESLFWGHHLLHRGRRLAQDLDLFFEFTDAVLGRGQLGGLGAAAAVLETTIDQILLFPAVQA